ncbi:glycerophosphoryl diester phosphodiesterase [Desulfocurvibacter africanus PCS]|uniref:Glycerophosphoryl diester phosphodiesterase n=1 Tax=Desulfocurvibacter africanus PCS TaxID=1262666 RepID=M5Q3S1_DESAF|nr:glycerophosphodiester phosphodiesterase family protein [Desulfocurvibacter africanus]EMG38938.1 glycerophosphoryl diester phosphodiesterase [Desulfocurvibacter africanus PCS]
MNIASLLSRPFAHRGLHDLRKGVPENSMAAFRLAVDSGYAIELDVRLLGDGNVVVFHDATLDRMTSRTGYVLALNSGQLSSLSLLGTQETPPLLSDLLNMVRGRVPLYVEIKNGNRPGRLEQQVLSLLNQYFTQYGGSFAVASFNPLVLAWFQRKAPHLLRVQITGNSGLRGLWLPQRCAAINWPLIAFGQPHALSVALNALGGPIVGACRCQGKPVLTWTVRTQNDLERAQRFADAYVFEGLRP